MRIRTITATLMQKSLPEEKKAKAKRRAVAELPPEDPEQAKGVLAQPKSKSPTCQLSGTGKFF
jgi:hypothetical protein